MKIRWGKLFDRTIWIIIILGLLSVGVSYAVSPLWSRHHREPIPKKDFYSIKVDIVILSQEEFKKKARWLLERDDVDLVSGLHVRYVDGNKEIFLPKDWAGRIDLESLGHEVFFHTMEGE
jgi:hypothetical protein